MEPALEYSWYTQWESTGENESFFCQWVSITNRFSVRRTLCPLLPFSTGADIPSGLNRWKPCAGGQSLWVCMCISPIVWETVSTSSSYSLPTSSSTQIPDLWAERVGEAISFRTECSEVSHSLHGVQVWVTAHVSLFMVLKRIQTQVLIPVVQALYYLIHIPVPRSIMSNLSLNWCSFHIIRTCSVVGTGRNVCLIKVCFLNVCILLKHYLHLEIQTGNWY